MPRAGLDGVVRVKQEDIARREDGAVGGSGTPASAPQGCAPAAAGAAAARRRWSTPLPLAALQ